MAEKPPKRHRSTSLALILSPCRRCEKPIKSNDPPFTAMGLRHIATLPPWRFAQHGGDMAVIVGALNQRETGRRWIVE
jgi:hypothetical protein